MRLGSEEGRISHDIDLVSFQLESGHEVAQSLVEELVDEGWAAYPHLLKGASMPGELFFDEIGSPSGLFLAARVGIGESHCRREHVKAELVIHAHHRLDQVQSDGLLPVLEGSVQVQLETALIEIKTCW